MKKENVKISELYDLSHSMAGQWLSQFTYPWEALSGISAMIRELGEKLPADEFDRVADDVWVHKSAKVAPTAHLGGPLIVCAEAEIRHCAFIRGSALVGEGAVVGNSTELKNVILFDKVQVPHYNYVGDSILGFKAHMGAGSITSNVKSDKLLVKVHAQDGDDRDGNQEVRRHDRRYGRDRLRLCAESRHGDRTGEQCVPAFQRARVRGWEVHLQTAGGNCAEA